MRTEQKFCPCGRGMIMRRCLLATALAFLFFSCRSAPQKAGYGAGAEHDSESQRLSEISEINSLLNTADYGRFAYIGIAPRMETRAKEIERAKLHIANQIAMNSACTVDAGIVSTYNNDFFRGSRDSNIDYRDETTEQLCETLEIIFCRHFSQLTVVAARHSEAAAQAAISVPKNEGGRPCWIRNVPKIDGCCVAVGISGAYSVPYRSMLVADVNAAQQLAIEQNAHIRTYTFDKATELNRNGANTASAKMVLGDVLLSQADLHGFYIISRWMEADGSCFYSLAVARKE